MKRFVAMFAFAACSAHHDPSVSEAASAQAVANEPSKRVCPILGDGALARGTSFPPLLLAQPVFEYPKELGESTSQDSAVVEFVVDRDGTVPECSIAIKTVSDPGLVPFVSPSIASLRFRPARGSGGVAAPSRLRLTLEFLPKAEADKRKARRLVLSVPHQTAPTLIADGTTPTYPTELIPQHLSGTVLVSVVVTAEGRIDPTSVAVVSSDHSLFTKAVRDVLPRLTFQPSMYGADSTRVATRIQIPFQFHAP